MLVARGRYRSNAANRSEGYNHARGVSVEISEMPNRRTTLDAALRLGNEMLKTHRADVQRVGLE